MQPAASVAQHGGCLSWPAAGYRPSARRTSARHRTAAARDSACRGGRLGALPPGLDKKERHEIRRKLRRMEREAPDAGALCPRRPGAGASGGGFHRAAPVQPADKHAFMTDEMQAYLRAIAAALAEQGWLQLSFLEVAGSRSPPISASTTATTSWFTTPATTRPAAAAQPWLGAVGAAHPARNHPGPRPLRLPAGRRGLQAPLRRRGLAGLPTLYIGRGLRSHHARNCRQRRGRHR